MTRDIDWTSFNNFQDNFSMQNNNLSIKIKFFRERAAFAMISFKTAHERVLYQVATLSVLIGVIVSKETAKCQQIYSLKKNKKLQTKHLIILHKRVWSGPSITSRKRGDKVF